MVKDAPQLINEVNAARALLIATASNLTFEQATFKPSAEAWCITEILEHMVRAEQAGISGIWKALDGFKRHQPVWVGEMVNRDLTIEEVVAKTWQEKEIVPEIAAPIWGGSLSFWIAMLRGMQVVLSELEKALDGVNLTDVIYPHPISGPLDVRQRLEFLRFHLNRHQGQIESLKQHPDFPQQTIHSYEN